MNNDLWPLLAHGKLPSMNSSYISCRHLWCTQCKLKLHWIHSAHPGSPVALVPPTCLSSRNSVETTQQFFHGMLWLLSYVHLGILRNFCVLVCWCGHTSAFGADVDIMEWTDLSKCLADFSWSQVIRVAVLWTRTEGQPWDRLKSKRNGYHCRKGALDHRSSMLIGVSNRSTASVRYHGVTCLRAWSNSNLPQNSSILFFPSQLH